MTLLPEVADPNNVVGQTERAVDELEARLIGLVQEAAHGGRPLDDVIATLGEIVGELRPPYVVAAELLGRRDLSFDLTTRLATLQHRLLWIYQKCRVERLFLSKLRLERKLRDDLQRFIAETWQEMLDLEDEERTVRSLSDDALERDLLSDQPAANPPPLQGPIGLVT